VTPSDRSGDEEDAVSTDATTADEVKAAADAIVAAYGAHRTDDYFRCFHPDATFVFYTSPERLTSRAAFREEWERWMKEDGFRVLECTSADQLVQDFGDVAVFSHDVRTVTSFNSGEETSLERETIVFARQQDGTWLAVHEHLSPAYAEGEQ
jgi:ketosteroid isomerase-like protein